MEEQLIDEIQHEYKKIDNRWLRLHYKTTVGLVIFSFFVELIMDIIMCNTDELHTTIPIFFLKFLFIPFALNALCIAVDFIVMHAEHLPQNIKIYIVSLMFIIICFVLFTAHVAFAALYYIFAIPVLLTTIYGNYRLTIAISAASMVSVITSELFIKWDIDKVSILNDSIRFGNFLISLFILLAFSAVCMVVIRFEREKNATGIQKEMERFQLEQRLQIDELTGIYNRNAFRNAVNAMAEDGSENSYIFVMIDIDNFKTLNDKFGHVKGDRCLIEFGSILKENCEDALPFRFGGDEFCLLLRNHTIEDVVRVCEKIQKDFLEVKIDNKSEITLTASFGIARYAKNMVPSKLIVHTDKALYEAKTIKNAIRIYQDKKAETV